MKPKHLIILVLFAALYSKSHCQWFDQKSGVSVNLIDVSFVDPMHGCIIGEESTILTTNDGGWNWVKRQSPVDDATFTKVQIIDESNGFIVGNDGLILKSVDGGKTWLQIYNQFDYNFSDISFIDSQNGWISCWLTDYTSPSRRDGAILHTSDGGIQWEIQLEIFGDIYDGTQFTSIDFFDGNIGWALGSSFVTENSPTYIYKTTNGGSVWEELATVYTKPLRELYCIDKNTLWVSWIYYLVSHDGGYNWTFDSDLNTYSMLASSPINNKAGWIYTYNIIAQISQILFTSSYGASWIEDLDLRGKYVNSMTNIDGEFLWIVGNNGFIKHRQSTPTDIENNYMQIDKFDLFQNYPNPFNPTTKISYQIPTSENVKITVYDLLGNEVAELVNENKNVGNYEVEFKANNLSSGVYFYQITAGNFIQSKKMILLR
jgi:photosystem II stability/assembly factor-like uncharacterized protein